MKKLLIAYDGSATADAALTDLNAAGLPDNIEACVMVVAEQWMPTPHSFGLVDLHLTDSEPSLAEKTEAIAQNAVQHLQASFPNWKLGSKLVGGSPAREIVQFADEWKPDLLCLGSHGHSALERFLLGSVSQKVANAAHCSVRIARGRVNEPDTPLRVMVGFDASQGSEAAIEAVLQRAWPASTEACLVTADFAIPTAATEKPRNAILQWVRDERARIHDAAQAACQKLQAAGLSVSTVLKDARPQELLCETARQWGADCIFVGANQLGRIDRFLLGSVSTSVALQAPCSVEIVRPTQEV